jgi:hypothetical protein
LRNLAVCCHHSPVAHPDARLAWLSVKFQLKERAANIHLDLEVVRVNSINPEKEGSFDVTNQERTVLFGFGEESA